MLYRLEGCMITCKDVSDLASDYLEGPITFVQRFRFRLHLIMCKHCRRYLTQLKLSIGVAQKISQPSQPTDEEIEALVEKLRELT